MVNTAILVGNSQYKNLGELSCCSKDLEVMRELLEATNKYSDIEVVENTDADDLKSRIRAIFDKITPTEELFFYFTGHGYMQDDKYYCQLASKTVQSNVKISNAFSSCPGSP